MKRKIKMGSFYPSKVEALGTIFPSHILWLIVRAIHTVRQITQDSRKVKKNDEGKMQRLNHRDTRQQA